MTSVDIKKKTEKDVFYGSSAKMKSNVYIMMKKD